MEGGDSWKFFNSLVCLTGGYCSAASDYRGTGEQHVATSAPLFERPDDVLRLPYDDPHTR